MLLSMLRPLCAFRDAADSLPSLAIAALTRWIRNAREAIKEIELDTVVKVC